VVASGPAESEVSAAAVDTARWLRELIAARAAGAVELVGPAPAPLQRIKGRWRWHLLLRSTDRAALGRIVRYAAARGPYAGARHTVKVTFDRDPVSLL